MLARRARRGKEHPSRRDERFGRASRPRPAGALIWVHAASVGETLAVLPAVERLQARGPTVLLTTGTVTAAEIAAGRLPAGAIHQFVPIDMPQAVADFLDHWRPGLALFAESELWPTMLKALADRDLPLVLVNARMSERSFRSWTSLRPVARALMRRIDLCLAQSEADAERLRSLGAREVRVSGNLKFDAPPPPADPAELASLREAIAPRSVLVAASTHPGEEEPVLATHARLARDGARLLTILAPRHPERGDLVAAEAAAAGLRVRRRSRGETIGDDTDLYLADTIGEMGLWYRLADVAFLGGSMVARGGQNPIEPAKLGVPILHGGHVANFRDVYAALEEAGAAARADDAAALASAVRALLDDPAARVGAGEAARACVARLGGALDRTLAAVEPYLASLPEHHGPVQRP